MPPVNVAVVGGGPAGMTAAIFASEAGANVTLFERKDRLGLKLSITGKRPLQSTNNCPPDEFLRSVPTNPRFLYSSLYAFSPQDVMAWFETLGVPLKTERGRRVFPVSDKASDVVGALRREVTKKLPRYPRASDRGFAKRAGSERSSAPQKACVALTASLSRRAACPIPQPAPRATGLGSAEALGIEVVPPKPALVPLETVESWCAEAMGLSLKNVALKVIDTESSKTVYEDFGEMIFTHFGVSGPMILFGIVISCRFCARQVPHFDRPQARTSTCAGSMREYCPISPNTQTATL